MTEKTYNIFVTILVIFTVMIGSFTSYISVRDELNRTEDTKVNSIAQENRTKWIMELL